MPRQLTLEEVLAKRGMPEVLDQAEADPRGLTRPQAEAVEVYRGNKAYSPGDWTGQLAADVQEQFVPEAGASEDATQKKVMQFLMNVAGMPGTSAPGVLAAVKQPGGMWHPEAVERLSGPLKDTLVTGHEAARLHNRVADRLEKELGRQPTHKELEAAGAFPPEDAWVTKAIRNYLNKYAGTERDPLKDLRVPGVTHPDDAIVPAPMHRWEELTDKAIWQEQAQYLGTARAPGTIPDEAWLRNAKPEELVAGLNVGGSVRPLTDYLSHTGDYLRQNVKPEDLQRYDLVRAIRETHANDARMAKQMEKAQQASSASLPVHKDYGDGFRWVELKKPEKLTPEQAAGVQLDSRLKGSGNYQAIGLDGKPLENAYTGQIAQGGSPEEAWLAGRLAEEGNSMGHCVGGYCKSVASGESRIFSLRGPDGKSHVTVETGSKGRRIEDEAGTGLPYGATSEDILQIKGKQNRAPVKEYLPYVQDFVRSGKWGEVGDLGNTGLHAVAAFKQLRENNLRAGLPRAEELYNRRFLTDAEFEYLSSGGKIPLKE